jgi:hypothetical protein
MGNLQSLSPSRPLGEDRLPPRRRSGALTNTRQHYNYPALVSALQTLGYAIKGFVAAAIIDQFGQSVAQVAIDEADVTTLYQQIGTTVLNMQQTFSSLEETVITTAEYRFLIRKLSASMFQALITSHDADLAECLSIMTNVEGPMSSAL